MIDRAPGPLLAVGLALCTLAFVTVHPLVMGAVAIAAAGLLAGAPAPRRAVAVVSVALGVGVAVLNPFVQANGDLILVELPRIPVFDTQVTVEELVAGLVLGARAAAVTMIVMAVLATADPDRLLRLASRLAPRSALAGSVAARMIPTLRRDAAGLVETLRLRGRSLTSGRWTRRVRTAGSLALPLVGSALDRSLDVAEAMAARGYGSGPATRPPRRPWGAADRIAALAAVAIGIVAACALLTSLDAYAFYPTMDRAWSGATAVLAVVVVGSVAALRLGARR